MQYTFRIQFSGRRLNASGSMQYITAHRTASTPIEAIELLYDEYEHIMLPTAIPIQVTIGYRISGQYADGCSLNEFNQRIFASAESAIETARQFVGSMPENLRNYLQSLKVFTVSINPDTLTVDNSHQPIPDCVTTIV